MRSARLLRLIGEADPKFIEVDSLEDRKLHPKKTTWAKWMSLVAFLVIAVSGGLGLFYHADDTHVIVYPDEGEQHFSSANMYCLSVKQPYSYFDIGQKAKVIVVADIVSVTQYELRETIADAKVCEVLKGDVAAGDKIKIVDNVVDEGVTTDGGPALMPGNRVLVFLDDSKLSSYDAGEQYYTYVLFSLGIGKFFYDRDGCYHASITYSDWYPSKYCSAIFEDYTPKTLEEIKDLIKQGGTRL